MNNIRSSAAPTYIGTHQKDDRIAIVVARAQTDFVSRNPDFRELVDNAAVFLLGCTEESQYESLMQSLQTNMQKFGEEIEFEFDTNPCGSQIATYKYHDANRFAMVLFDGPITSELGRKIACQIVASAPTTINKDKVSDYAERVEAQKQIAIEAGKPENIAERIAEGKVRNDLKEFVLYEMPFYLDNSKTVGAFIKEHSLPNVIDFKLYC